MIIEHAAIYVKDIDQAIRFFEDYLGGSAGPLYHNPRTGFRSRFVKFEDGAILEIMNRDNLKEADRSGYQTGFAHLCFSVGSKDKVDEMTERWRKDGYQVLSGPRTTGDGYYETCILDREGNQIEITV